MTNLPILAATANAQRYWLTSRKKKRGRCVLVFRWRFWIDDTRSAKMNHFDLYIAIIWRVCPRVVMWIFVMNTIASMNCITSSSKQTSCICINSMNPASNHLETTPYLPIIQQWFFTMRSLNLSSLWSYWAPNNLRCIRMYPRRHISGSARIWLSLSRIR